MTTARGYQNAPLFFEAAFRRIRLLKGVLGPLSRRAEWNSDVQVALATRNARTPG